MTHTLGPWLFTSGTPILDGEVYRHDWEGSPRFYLVRIYPYDPREAPSHPHLYTPRVQVRVELEGDPTAWANRTPDDFPDEIKEAVFECIGEIEDMRADKWESEQDWERQLRDADYWRSRI